jgi:hypothetical protein
MNVRRCVAAWRADVSVCLTIAIALTSLAHLTQAAESRGADQQSVRSLRDLRTGSGWVLLGSLDVGSNKWASLLKHKTDGRGDGTPHLPSAGDVIEVTARLEVYILEYERLGEERLLESPVGVVRATRDFTGVVLTPGTRLRVERIEKGKVTGSLQSVWALVSEP